jgi:hypothetical protein
MIGAIEVVAQSEVVVVQVQFPVVFGFAVENSHDRSFVLGQERCVLGHLICSFPDFPNFKNKMRRREQGITK